MTSNSKLVQGLEQVLAETYALYLKTQNYHWNVTGMHFHSLHAFFEEQYKALASAVDEIAERIRTLDAPAPGSFKEFQQLSTLSEPIQDGNDKSMLEDLLNSHKTLSTTLQSTWEVADSSGDEVTADFLVDRLSEHRQFSWMLKAHLS